MELFAIVPFYFCVYVILINAKTLRFTTSNFVLFSIPQILYGFYCKQFFPLTTDVHPVLSKLSKINGNELYRKKYECISSCLA